MTEPSSQPEPVDPGHDPGVDPPPDRDAVNGGEADKADREDRPGVTADPDDPDDTDFNASPGLVE